MAKGTSIKPQEAYRANSCGTCEAFCPLTNDLPRHGLCRKMPPTVFVFVEGKISTWPDVKGDDWCKAWERRTTP